MQRKGKGGEGRVGVRVGVRVGRGVGRVGVGRGGWMEE